MIFQLFDFMSENYDMYIDWMTTFADHGIIILIRMITIH
jgi:hypothetical protein